MLSLNYLRYLLRRPERGYDPVPAEHAATNAASEWSKYEAGEYTPLVDSLEGLVGGFKGKSVLDLGGGPGHFAVEFARRGASVTWHDVSTRYKEIAESRAAAHNVTIAFSLGYFEDAQAFAEVGFDFVFNRIAWMYCIDDRRFASLIYRLVRPGGAAYIDSHRIALTDFWKRIGYLTNAYLHWKNNYVPPPPGRIARLIQRYAIEYAVVDYRSGKNDRVFFTKAR